MYRIFTDAAVDLPDYFWDDTEVYVLPMDYEIDGETYTYVPHVQEDLKLDFYTKLREGALASTTQITPFQFEEVFRKHLESGEDILYLAFSKKLSSTYESSLMAKKVLEEEFPERKIVCLDSICCSGGLGQIVKDMEENRLAGMSLDDNVSYHEENWDSYAHYFMVSDLKYLARGGRISAVAGTLGTALKMKPLMLMDHTGELKVFKKVRGFKAAVKGLIQVYEDFHRSLDGDLWITYTGNREMAEEAKKMFQDGGVTGDIQLVHQTPIVGAHIGPDFIATFYRAKDGKCRFQEGAK